MSVCHISPDPELLDALFFWWDGDSPSEGATLSCAPGDVALLLDDALLLARFDEGEHTLTAKDTPALAPYFEHHLLSKPRPIDVCFVRSRPVPVEIAGSLDPDDPEGPSFEIEFMLRLTNAELFVAKLFAVESGLADDDDEPDFDLWIAEQLYAVTERELEIHGTKLDAQGRELLRDINRLLAKAGLESTAISSLVVHDGPLPGDSDV